MTRALEAPLDGHGDPLVRTGGCGEGGIDVGADVAAHPDARAGRIDERALIAARPAVSLIVRDADGHRSAAAAAVSIAGREGDVIHPAVPVPEPLAA